MPEPGAQYPGQTQQLRTSAWHFLGPCGEPELFRARLMNDGKFTHAHCKDGKTEGQRGQGT